MDIFAVGLLAYRTLFYRPRLAAPSQIVGALGFMGRALGFIILSSAYFSVIDRTRESGVLSSQVVRDLVNKKLFSRKNITSVYMTLDWLKRNQQFSE